MAKEKSSFLDKIVMDKVPCVFVSPHFDDAVLSCGGLLSYLSGKTQVSLVNVFTQAGVRPYTLSAKVFLAKCGFDDARKLYEQRATEDAEVFKNLKVKVVNLGFTEALWRKKSNFNIIDKLVGRLIPEVNHVYKTYRFHIIKGKISAKDRKTVFEISRRMESIVGREKNAVLFSPLAIGNHVDHVIVRDVCDDLEVSSVFWSDFPYSLRRPEASEFLEKYEFSTLIFNKNQADRVRLIRDYKTQIGGLFPDGKIKLTSEKYFFKLNRLR